MVLSKMILSITTFSLMTLSITTLSIMTLSIKTCNIMTLSMTNKAQHTAYWHSDVMLNVINQTSVMYAKIS